jgi:hypothetical protein
MVSGLDAAASLASIDCSVPLADIYRDVRFEERKASATEP